VENLRGMGDGFSTIVDNMGTFVATVARQFGVPDEEKSIAGFTAKYDAAIVLKAFETVVARLERGDTIDNPIAYFYTVVKVMQAEQDERESGHGDDDRKRLVIARNWARTLLREWPPHQVRAILADTYRSPEFVDEVMADLGRDR